MPLRLLLLLAVPELAFALAVSGNDPRFAPLLSYMTSRGAQIGPITLAKSKSGAGNGAFVTQDVEEDEVLFTVPKAACVGLYTACGDEEVGDSLAQIAVRGQGGATVALAGFLSKEWLCRGEAGPYGPYLAMLPWEADWPPEGEQEQEHVLWWSEGQIDTLEGCDAFEDAVGLREEVALAARVCKSILGKSVRQAYKADPGYKSFDNGVLPEDSDYKPSSRWASRRPTVDPSCRWADEDEQRPRRRPKGPNWDR